MRDVPVKVSARLTKSEAEKFQKDFNELESHRITDVAMLEDGDHVIITLSSAMVGCDLLRASLRDGLLRHWGWGAKFVSVE